MKIEGADLFCGAGGTSEGMLRAANQLGFDLQLLAINHWPVAINSHTLNHPTVRHKCESLDTIKPREQVPSGRLHILSASPECTHHSLAAGGKPKNDQSRATAWHVCRWAADLRVDNILIENVQEFMSWGPLDSRGKPIKSRKGETFRAFVRALESMDYRVEYRVQCAADFGDPTSRRRLIILARRGGKPVVWPRPTHGKGLKPYRTAREIIDWSIQGKSIFNRKKPLSKNTLRRIEAGLKRFCGEHAQPFLIKLYGTNNAVSVDSPMPTVTAGGNHLGLVQPFLVPYHSGVGREDKRVYSVDEPLKTQDTQNRYALVEPFVIGQHGGAVARSVDQPLPTITTDGAIALIQPFLIQTDQTGGKGAYTRSLDKPLPTIVSKQNVALIQPFLAKYYGTGTATSVDEPLDAVTTKDRFALVEPQENGVDILLRMLNPEELQQAMSFPRDYKFYGTKEQAVKQIGNAVPVELARAHVIALLAN